MPTMQAKPKPNYTKFRLTPSGPIQHAKDSTNTSQRLTTRPNHPMNRGTKLPKVIRSKQRGLNPMQSSRKRHRSDHPNPTMKIQGESKDKNQPSNNQTKTCSKGRRPTPLGSIEMTPPSPGHQIAPLTRLLRSNPRGYGNRERSTHTERSATTGTRHLQGKNPFKGTGAKPQNRININAAWQEQDIQPVTGPEGTETGKEEPKSN